MESFDTSLSMIGIQRSSVKPVTVYSQLVKLSPTMVTGGQGYESQVVLTPVPSNLSFQTVFG